MLLYLLTLHFINDSSERSINCFTRLNMTAYFKTISSFVIICLIICTYICRLLITIYVYIECIYIIIDYVTYMYKYDNVLLSKIISSSRLLYSYWFFFLRPSIITVSPDDEHPSLLGTLVYGEYKSDKLCAVYLLRPAVNVLQR